MAESKPGIMGERCKLTSGILNKSPMQPLIPSTGSNTMRSSKTRELSQQFRLVKRGNLVNSPKEISIKSASA